MRDTKRVLDVVCGVNESENNIVTPDDVVIPKAFASICFNVFKVSNLGVSTAWSSPMSKNFVELMNSHSQNIAQLSPAVLRCHSTKTVASGTSFAIAPGTIISSSCAGQNLPPPIIATYKQETREVVINALHTPCASKPGYAIEKTLEFSGSVMKDRDTSVVVTDTQRIDPILGQTGNFNIFDIALFSVEYADQPKVLFIPSASCVQPGSTIATISFPGSELLDNTDYTNSLIPYSYRNSIPNFHYLKQIFYQFGGLCASVGTILRPYGENNKQWIERDSTEYTPHNHYALVSDETLFDGSSGGPLVCLDNLKIYKIEDKTGIDWTLVEFVGIHTGGEFVSCIDCLRQLPKTRAIQNPSTLKVCEVCTSDEPPKLKKSKTYNHSISVHHEMFAEMYKTSVIPKIRELFGTLPEGILAYINVH